MHNNWEELIPYYIAGTLSKTEASRLENHVATCDDCRKSLDEWRQIASVVRADAASQMRDLPPLSARVLQVANGQASVRHYGYAPPATPQPTRGYRSASITLIAAVVTVVLIGGLLTLMLTRSQQQQQGVALLPTATVTVNLATATSLAPSAVPSVAALVISPQASQSASSSGLTPQIIVIEPSATPVSPTPTLGAATILPTSTIAVPTYVVPTLVYPTPLRLPTRIYPTAVPPNNSQPTMMPTPASSQDFQPFALVQTPMACTLQVAQTGTVVNLYSGAGTNYPVIRTFSSGDQLIALGKSDNGWYRVQYDPGSDQSVGWMQQTLVVTSGSCDNLPVISIAATPIPTPTMIPVQPLVLISSDVTLYSGPGTNYPTVGTARGGVSYDVQAQSANWYLITLSTGGTAWVSAALVQLSPPDAIIPQAAILPPTPAPTASSATVSPAP